MKRRLPVFLCLALTISAVWLTWQSFVRTIPISAPRRPPTVGLNRTLPTPSPVHTAITALTRAVPAPGPTFGSLRRVDGSWEYTFAREHPEYLDLAAAMHEEALAVDYAPLFRLLQLNPAQRSTLLRAMVERRIASIVGRSGDPNDHADYAQRTFGLRRQIEAELKRSLEPSAFDTFLWYDRIPPVARDNLAGIVERLAFVGQTLTPDQERAVWGVIESAFRNPADAELVADFYKTGLLNEGLLERMGQCLSAEQLRTALAAAHERTEQRKLGVPQSPARVRYH